MNRQFLYAHGFGVGKDARGLFTDIADSFPNDFHAMVDLNDRHTPDQHMLTIPLEDQAARLLNRATELKQVNVLIAHSMGSIVAALMPHQDIGHMIFIAPSINNNMQKTIDNFRKRANTIIDMNGMSILTRADGSKTYVPAAFWPSRQRYQPLELYKKTPTDRLDIIIASQDDVIDTAVLDKLGEHIHVHYLDGDHNFSGADRTGLLTKLKELL